MFSASRWAYSVHGDVICLMAGNSAGSGTRNRFPAVRREPYIARSVQDQPADGRSFLGAVARHRRTPPTARQRPAPMAAETRVSSPLRPPAEFAAGYMARNTRNKGRAGSANFGVLAAVQLHEVGVVAALWLCDVGVLAAV